MSDTNFLNEPNGQKFYFFEPKWMWVVRGPSKITWQYQKQDLCKNVPFEKEHLSCSLRFGEELNSCY